jgi:hypothetical protein
MIFVREFVRGRGKSKSIRRGVKKNFGFLKP